MNTELKRNDPCHCESGKKFKNCHGDSSSKKQFPWGPWAIILALIIGFSFLPDKNSGANKEVVSRPYVPKTVNNVKKPEGEAPAGKVWSAEHGHWHYANDDRNFSKSHSSMNGGAQIGDPNSPPPGKVWSPEHGHWHDK